MDVFEAGIAESVGNDCFCQFCFFMANYISLRLKIAPILVTTDFDVRVLMTSLFERQIFRNATINELLEKFE